MLIRQIGSRAKTEAAYVSVLNSTGAALSAGYHVCFNTTLKASATGFDVQKPLTSALPNYAGVVANDGQGTAYAIADGDFGLVQAYGKCDGAFVRFESTQTNGLVEGQILGPITGQWYAQSNGQSFALGPLVAMSRIAAGTFEGRTPVFVRAL